MLSQFLCKASTITSNSLICASRTLQLTIPKNDRFSREYLRSRLNKLKLDQKPVHIKEVECSHKDVIPIRPISHLKTVVAFAGAVTVGSFTLAAIIKYEREKEQIKTIIQNINGYFGQTHNDAARPNSAIDWNRLTLPQKVAAGIIMTNAVVTVLWKVPRLVPFMTTYFTNSFAQKKLCLPMLTSVFSHASFIHFGLNMYVLSTFAPVAMHKFAGVEYFCALYASAGVVSSMTSLIHKAIIRAPSRALGASGAILGILTYTCMKMPEARLHIIFIPGLEFSAENAVIGILIMDIIGLVGPWKMFDHAAHLGGALFGITYALWGEQFIRHYFENQVMTVYEKIKNKFR
uniref:Rhomboid domain-containing protein n=1 Tax=Rhabditophanes sp. KR3021 TaxID=114890 RepID=A0AC35UHZ8_9BILA